jgi:transposase
LPRQRFPQVGERVDAQVLARPHHAVQHRRRRAPLGAAAAQLGPDAQAAVVELNKQGGLSHGKVTRCLESLFGIPLSRGGSVHIVLRAASRCEPVYESIRKSVGDSKWVVPDETGWRVGGLPAWLHALVGPQATAYVIDPTRSGAVAEGTPWYSGPIKDNH